MPVNYDIKEITPVFPSSDIDTYVDDKVTDQFKFAQQYADGAFSTADSYIQALRDIFTSASMPSYDINYDAQEITTDANFADAKPEALDASSLVPEVVDGPSEPDISEPDIPDFNTLTEITNSPTTSYSYEEPTYDIELAEKITTALVSYVDNGGTGLGESIEDALWTRARERQEIANERIYNEAENYFAARGWTMPPGALSGRLMEALAEQTRADAAINNEISIEQARLARAQTNDTLQLALTDERQKREYKTAEANRALANAMQAVDAIVKTYGMKVQEYASNLQKVSIESEAESRKANAQIGVNQSKTALYSANIQKYIADIGKELNVVEQIGKVYALQIAGYESAAKVESMRLDAVIKEFQANIQQSTNQTELSIKEAEITLRNYIGALELQTESTKASANISAQIAASALSSINATAQMGYSVNRAHNQQISHSTQVSNSVGVTQTS